MNKIITEYSKQIKSINTSKSRLRSESKHLTNKIEITQKIKTNPTLNTIIKSSTFFLI